MMEKEVLLEVKNLKKWFPIKRGLSFSEKRYIKAVDDVSFTVYKGETLGLVGESGCGKSTLARTILRLIEPTGGQVLYRGEDFLQKGKREVKEMRSNLQIVFQDPYGSLHPKMRVGKIIEAPLVISKYGDKEMRKERVNELVEMVDLKPEHLKRYPHEFSGGQRQRIVIARTLATNPDFVICDEPVSALDVSVRSQILNLLRDLQEKLGLTYLFISHDLSVVEHICDRVVVMYLGKVVEMATSEALFTNPQHPYTRALLSAAPQIFEENRSDRITLDGDVPSPANPPKGCRLHTRCPHSTERCTEEPPLIDIGDGHLVSCHLCQRSE
ncbi:MAG: dipeptide ABC transporter ATP-binding protein [Christensenellaceae bacterium]|nr:dipeptide ABC transporter ATP-binding protein [Christensenellaceae bacterium]